MCPDGPVVGAQHDGPTRDLQSDGIDRSHMVHVAMGDLASLPVGDVVALLGVGASTSEASLAVSQSMDTAITALRLLERRR